MIDVNHLPKHDPNKNGPMLAKNGRAQKRPKTDAVDMRTTPYHPQWPQRARRILSAPFRFGFDVAFCGFVVIAAYWMLVLCTMLALLDNAVFSPVSNLMARTHLQRAR